MSEEKGDPRVRAILSMVAGDSYQDFNLSEQARGSGFNEVTTTRALRDVLHERIRQHLRLFRAEGDDLHTMERWATLIAKQLGEGVESREHDRQRQQLLRAAALAVAAVESFDRKRVDVKPCPDCGQPIINGQHASHAGGKPS